MAWYVLYVKSKYEIKAATTLEKMGIEVYCPVIKEMRQWSDRKKMVTKPLFSSYLFIKIQEQNREKVFDVTGIVRYVYWLGKPAMVHDEEIETIREWVESGTTEKIVVEGLSPGDRIKLKSGVFKDQEAKIIDIGKNTMRLILVDIGFTVTVKLKEIQS
ncbi:UpxY family transcription antiterminator [Gillisia limnaea]|jgi:transcription antitermination factor NusG|uniref:Transcription antitermination protein nusG n=1 Tax=Gillisia limnaea (strain DSM 15749 / LMG 21470 / R-8282) TaxID=865937 RepID=H2BTL5_GILLR|nr:UpxY family transcription antiterminator [Gillisia limnaea]EHQ02635.1 transcription antitermination protein nusG [Gillisia limnaea DSM 15749]